MPEFECIGRYRLINLIGGGGMGEVWGVIDPELGIPKAMKVLRPSLSWNEQYRSLFSREADVAAQLGRHPGFPAIHDFDASGAFAYLVMDYIDGVNLRALIPRGGFSEGVVVHIMRALFRALRIAHGNRRGNSEANVVHGDLKPENIMISSHGDVFLTDFGISRFVEGPVVTTSVIGTIPYMAPETFDGVVCVQSDLFAAGLILHELLTGERVNRKKATVLDVKRLYKQGIPPLRFAVHPTLEHLRDMLLQIEVEDRLPSADAALDRLARIELIDRGDELADQYQRVIGPPHTGLTKYLEAMDGKESFVHEYFQSQREAAKSPAATVSVGSGHEVAEEDQPGHTVAVPDEELRALREGRGVPTPSHIVEASTEPVEAATRIHRDPVRTRRPWPMLAAVLLISIAGGAGTGLLWFGDPRTPTTARPGLVTHPAMGPVTIANPEREEPRPPEIPDPVTEPQPMPTPRPEVAAQQATDAGNSQPTMKPRPKAPGPISPPKVRTVFYVGTGHPAAEIKVGKSRHRVSVLRGDPSFEVMLPEGTTNVSFCDERGACRRYGVVRVPRLQASQSLFVNLRGERLVVKRRGG